jgi:hypothetical protein
MKKLGNVGFQYEEEHRDWYTSILSIVDVTKSLMLRQIRNAYRIQVVQLL